MRRSYGSCSMRECSVVLLSAIVMANASAATLEEGMVLGQTVTVAGQDFFQGFVAAWREKDISEGSLIVVRERPSARTGSVIWIEHRGGRLLQLSLPASRGQLRGMGEQAADAAWQRLTEEALEARLDANQDLARDEL